MHSSFPREVGHGERSQGHSNSINLLFRGMKEGKVQCAHMDFVLYVFVVGLVNYTRMGQFRKETLHSFVLRRTHAAN